MLKGTFSKVFALLLVSLLISSLFSPEVTQGATPKVRHSVKPLDLSRPPTTEELIAAGQLGGLLYPTEDIEINASKVPAGGVNEAKIKRNQAINLSFGEAIQEWNKHKYKHAVELFKKHLTDYPDSPWASEAVLHIGCDAVYHGRYTEAEERFKWILDKNKSNAHEGAKILVNKAKLRLGNIKVFQGNFKEAMERFKELKRDGSDWRERTYASHWIQRISRYKKNELAMLNCGVLALAHLLKMEGRETDAREVMEILPSSLNGQSLQDLRSISEKYGYHLTGLKISVAELKEVPLPAIVQLSGRKEGDKGHYWIVEKWSDESLSFFDPQTGHRFQQSPEEFSREWDGNVLIFVGKAEQENLPGIRLSENEMAGCYGGCCGSPPPEGGTGDPDRCESGASGGFPTWSVNMINMNLFVTDMPLWYESPVGPPVEITLSYNSQSGIAYHEPFGNKWQFNYGSYLIVDTAGNVTVFMPDGRRDTFTPDGGGGYIRPYQIYNKLTRIAENHFELRSPDDTVYVYKIPSGTTSLQPFITEIRDPYGQRLTFTYNSNVQLVAITDATGRNTTLTYNADGLVTQVHDPFGRSATFQYDANRNLTRITDMGGYWSSFSYDQDIYLTRIEDAKGKWDFYIEPADGVPANSDNYPPPGDDMWENYRITITDPLGGKEEYMYYAGCESDPDVTSEMDNSCRGYSWHVRPRDYISWQSEQVNNFRMNPPKTRYLFSLIPSSLREEIGTVLFPEGGKIKYGYDIYGNTTSVTDSHGHTTRYTFNAMGQITSITDPIGTTTNMTYAGNNVDLLQIQNGLGTMTMTYNSFHDVTSLTDRLGNATNYTYNSLGKIISKTNALGLATHFTYDSNQRLQQITKDSKTLESYTFDSIGRIKTFTSATGLSLTFDYNGLNDFTKVTYPDGRFETYAYTGCCPHLKESETDRSGRTTKYSYDRLKRLTEANSPEGGVTRFAYDANSNLVRLIDLNSHVTTFDYDMDDRLIKKIYADGKSLSLTYDQAGLLKTRTNARGINTDYTYNANHNLMTTSYSDGTPGVTYQYDNFNRVTQREDGVGIYKFTYDVNSRLIRVDGPWIDDTITSQYNALGQITSLSPQGGQAVSYTYDILNRLKGIQMGTDTFSYGYTGASPLEQILNRPNESSTHYKYDALNRLTEISNKNSAAEIINQYSYFYNQQDNRSSETIVNGNAITSLQNELIAYNYNTVNQLLSSTNPDMAFSYDDDGNMMEGYTSEGYRFTASYDGENRLKSIEYINGSGEVRTSDYLYNGDDYLSQVKKYENGVLLSDIRFVRDDFLLLQERDGGNNTIREYTWGIDLGGGISGLLRLKQGGLDYYYLYDGKGNITAVIDKLQALVATYTYDSFGNLVSRTGILNQPMQFSTKPYDEEMGLSYFGYRFYSPTLGRWITRDPLGEKGGINLYTYTHNNPINSIDPLGLLDPEGGWTYSKEDYEKGVESISKKIMEKAKAEGKEIKAEVCTAHAEEIMKEMGKGEGNWLKGNDAEIDRLKKEIEEGKCSEKEKKKKEEKIKEIRKKLEKAIREIHGRTGCKATL